MRFGRKGRSPGLFPQCDQCYANDDQAGPQHDFKSYLLDISEEYGAQG